VVREVSQARVDRKYKQSEFIPRKRGYGARDEKGANPYTKKKEIKTEEAVKKKENWFYREKNGPFWHRKRGNIKNVKKKGKCYFFQTKEEEA